MKQVEVTILGQSYRLTCPDDGEALLHAAVARVDREMSAIRDAGKVKARERMAVLAALNLAYLLADQTASPPAAPAPPAPPPPAPRANGAAAALSSDDDARLDRLIQQIDDALGDDGHLL